MRKWFDPGAPALLFIVTLMLVTPARADVDAVLAGWAVVSRADAVSADTEAEPDPLVDEVGDA